MSRADPTGLSFLENVGDYIEIVWQLPQEIIGAIGGIGGSPIDYDGPSDTVIIGDSWLAKASGAYITLGHYVLAPNQEIDRDIMEHEYVHRGQSGALGPIYLLATGAGYLIGGWVNVLLRGRLDYFEAHDASPLEVDADARSGVPGNVKGNWIIREYWLKE